MYNIYVLTVWFNCGKESIVVTTETFVSLLKNVLSQPKCGMFCQNKSMLRYQLKCYDGVWFNVIAVKIATLINLPEKTF